MEYKDRTSPFIDFPAHNEHEENEDDQMEEEEAANEELQQIDQRIRTQKLVILKSTHLALLKRDDYILYGLEDICRLLFCGRDKNEPIIHPESSIENVNTASTVIDRGPSPPFLYIFRDRECFVVYSLAWFILIGENDDIDC
jgi:hypothetical protein